MNFAIRLLAAVLAVGLLPSLADANPRHCPPGLAKRDPPCIPPGQVGRRDNTDRRHDDDGRRDDARWDDRDHWDDRDRWDDRDWSRYDDRRWDYIRGEDFRDRDYVLVRDPRLFGLDPYGRADWRYYLVRDLIVRADPDALRILGVVGLIGDFLN